MENDIRMIFVVEIETLFDEVVSQSEHLKITRYVMISHGTM